MARQIIIAFFPACERDSNLQQIYLECSLLRLFQFPVKTISYAQNT